MGPLTSNCPALVSQVSQVPQVPLVSILLTRSMCSTTNSSCGKFFGGEGVKIELPKFLMVGKSLIIISFTISFDWKLSGELIARGVNLNIRDKTSQELTYHDCAAPHCWPEFSNRFQALESRVNHRRYFSVVWERWQQQCFRLAICASLKLRFDPNYEHQFKYIFSIFSLPDYSWSQTHCGENLWCHGAGQGLGQFRFQPSTCVPPRVLATFSNITAERVANSSSHLWLIGD